VESSWVVCAVFVRVDAAASSSVAEQETVLMILLIAR